MPIEFACHQCQTRLRVRDEVAGQQARCPKCGATLEVPRQSTAAPTPAPGPASPPPAPPRDSGYPSGAPGELNPYASPAMAAQPAAGRASITPGVLDLGQVLSRTWETYKLQMGMCIVGFLIAGAMNFGGSMAGNVLVQGVASVTRERAVVMSVQVIVSLAQQVFQQWINIGAILFFLGIARGQQPDIPSLFKGAPYLLQSVLALILIYVVSIPVAALLIGAPAGITYLATGNGDATAIAALIGLAICFIPLIYASLAVSQVNYLIVDQGLDAISAFKESWRITRGNMLNLFLTFLVLGVIGAAGVLACCVGVLFTVPFTMLGMGYTYLMMSQAKEASQTARAY